jgi:hypothetical protein
MNMPEPNKQSEERGNGVDSINAGSFGSHESSKDRGTAQGTGTSSNPMGQRSFGSTGTGSQMQSGAMGQTTAEDHTEGIVARTIEQQTAKLPSDTFLWAAVGAMATSAVLELSGMKDKSRFIGQWVAPLLLFGVYNKLVKVHGSDKVHGHGG